MAMAAALVAFTGGVYYASMNKLKQVCVRASRSRVRAAPSPSPVVSGASGAPPALAAPRTGARVAESLRGAIA
jgi:hypothetical protein